uniref:Cation/H+ exchanger transmembrane domain-containing protein n=1 Tax=Vespula pensylvanica TaxID=30213 RepID=A0A834K838_VESPE|nr:hypothetical protein H0235_015207 [Vespula pensylvanica]
MVPLRVLMLLGGGMVAVFGSEAIELGGAGPLAVVAAAFVSCYFWQKDGWEVDDVSIAGLTIISHNDGSSPGTEGERSRLSVPLKFGITCFLHNADRLIAIWDYERTSALVSSLEYPSVESIRPNVVNYPFNVGDQRHWHFLKLLLLSRGWHFPDYSGYRRIARRAALTHESKSNPVATSFEIFWMIFEPILFGITGTQITIAELKGKTVYLGISCLIAGIVIRIIVTIFVGIGSKLNTKEKVFISLSWMAKATVQAALGPVTLDEVNRDNVEQVEYANTVLTLCVLSILLTAPTGAIIISLSGPKLLTKTTTPSAPPDAWKTRRPSIRDISIINEDPDLEETASERKP